MARRTAPLLSSALVLASLAACSSDGGSAEPSGTGGPTEIPAACDPLDPTYCGFPIPNSYFTVADPSTPTGQRLHLPAEVMPVTPRGVSTSPAELGQCDGWSAGIPAMTFLKGATTAGLPSSNTIARSLEADSPTVFLDAETGERIAHFSELDQDGPVGLKALLIRPAVRLADNHRYIVALRNIQDASGAVLPASPAFVALRDGGAFPHASIEARRPLFEDIFEKLAAAGVARKDLQLAWDYKTASTENNTGRLLAMRDEALAKVGENGPAYTIKSIETDWKPESIKFRVEGEVEVPLYLDQPKPGSRLLLDAAGKPQLNATTPVLRVPFELLIPKSAEETPARIVVYGHGLLGERSQIEGSGFPAFMNEYNYAFVGVDLIGMSHEDIGYITSSITSGQLETLARTFDRLHQGTLNFLVTTRMMRTSFATDKHAANESQKLGRFLDPEHVYYHGISQGGIFGGVYMALATDVTRGVLGVPGQPYALLLDRSVDFVPFKGFLGMAYNGWKNDDSYRNRLDRLFLLTLTQHYWDRVEPSGYTQFIRENPLPNTPAHDVLIRAAIGDHQVSTLGAHIMARVIGAQHIDSGLRDVYGLTKVTGAMSGSGYIEYDFGLPPEPICNVPMTACEEDPHGLVRTRPEALQQMDLFLRTGELKNFCAGGHCSFPTLAECTAQAETPVCEAQ